MTALKPPPLPPRATVATITHHTPATWRPATPPAPKPSADAERILRLPTAHHPVLGALGRDLAANGATYDQAVAAISKEADRLAINWLDIEMSQPGSACRVPFAVTAAPSPQGEFQASVSGHVRQMLEVGHVPPRR